MDPGYLVSVGMTGSQGRGDQVQHLTIRGKVDLLTRQP